VQLVFIVVSTTITAATATADDMYVTANSGYENRTNRRWFSGKDRRHDDRDGNSDSSYWKEIVDKNNHNKSHDDMEGSIIQKYRPKNRLGLFHFGRINQLSVFETNNNNQLNDGNHNSNKEEHPLRTNLWEMNLKWSYLSPNSKILSRASERKRKRREKIVQLELNPEGYCRIIESTITKNNQDQDCSDSPVLGIGRWKKRPWGVTIVVRPLRKLKSSLDSTNFDDDDDDGDRRCDNKTYSKDKKNVNIIDEQTEFIFHANNFHWNGFGSNPKLTQGTILLQKQKKKDNTCWWKSTTWAYSSILPVWPEELSGENDDDKAVVNSSDISFGSVCSDFLRFSGIFNVGNNNISTRRSWFRPVVGTFTAKGITRK
jgi:hypothetical protein